MGGAHRAGPDGSGGRVLLLDRDGVINADSEDYVRSVEEWVPLPGAMEAIGRLGRAGYRIGVVTNQSGLARGYFDMGALLAMTRELQHRAREAGATIDGFFFCPHGPEDGCTCRKPAPGLLLDACRRFGVGPAEVTVVGDSLRDLQAAEAIGARAILVRTGNGERTLGELEALGPAAPACLVCDDLAALAERWT